MPAAPPETPSEVVVQLRPRRTRAGLSQLQLADRVGASRQAINAIEAGRQIPSTALALKLARELRCTVDELFRLTSGAFVDADLAPGQLGRVVVGYVQGRWIGHAQHASGQAADGVVVGGTPSSSTSRVELLGDIASTRANVLVAGCAPLLGVLAGRLGRHHHDARASWISANSGASLELLTRARVHMAGIHLAEASDNKTHEKAAQQALPGCTSILVNVARWRQGLLVAPGNPLAIRSAADVCRQGVRCVSRESGAAAQELLERAVQTAGLQLPATAAETPTAQGHADVARLIQWGLADVGVAIEACAVEAGLDFVPLAEERFDLVVSQASAETPAVQRFLEQLDRPGFRAETGHLPGYDLSTAGHASTVHHDEAAR